MRQSWRDADRGMRDADRGMRDADRGVRDADGGMRDADRGMRDADRGMRSGPISHSMRRADESQGVRPVYSGCDRGPGTVPLYKRQRPPLRQQRSRRVVLGKR